MKTSFGILLVAFTICAGATAQQPATSQQPDQQNASDVRARIESWVKSQSQQPAPANDDKIEVELVGKPRRFGTSLPLSAVVIEGAVFTAIGDTLIPWPGGGASGCFDPNGAETRAKLERARAEWAKQLDKTMKRNQTEPHPIK